MMKPSCQDKTSQSAPGQSLLKFMDMASDAVKCALKKPTNFKRNINHRRYLQRQVKTFVKSRRSKNNCQRKVQSTDLREDVQDLVREAIKELKYSHCYANADTVQSGRVTASPPPARTENQLDITSSKNMNTTYRLTHLPLEKPTMNNRHVFHSYPVHKEQFIQHPVTLPLSHAEEDPFMSGEELTNNIDINDLYIPELHEPRSPVVNCEDYFMGNDLDIPSPLYNSRDSDNNFQFHFDNFNQRIPKFEDFFLNN